MRYVIFVTMFTSGCYSAQLDTLEYCSFEYRSFFTIDYYQVIDCTGLVEPERRKQYKEDLLESQALDLIEKESSKSK